MGVRVMGSIKGLRHRETNGRMGSKPGAINGGA